MMGWFGTRYGAAIYSEIPQMETPVGGSCRHCKEAIEAGEDGFVQADGGPFHRACWLRNVVGSVAHQEKRCLCYGGPEEDNEVSCMTVREEAEDAVRFYEQGPQLSARGLCDRG